MPIAHHVFTETSPAAPGTAASSQAVTNVAGYGTVPGVCALLDDYDAVDVVCEQQGATNGTLQIFVQVSPDGGINWYDVIAFPRMAAGQALAFYQVPLSLATTTNVPIPVGKNLSPALGVGVSSGAVVNGAFTDRMRLVMSAGAGTSVGASVVVRVCPQRTRARETGE